MSSTRVVLCLALCACTSSPLAVEATAPSTRLAARPALASLVTRDKKLSIEGGGGDLRVAVRRADGALVADGLTLDQLRAVDPELHGIVTTGHAGAYLDATLDLPSTTAP